MGDPCEGVQTLPPQTKNPRYSPVIARVKFFLVTYKNVLCRYYSGWLSVSCFNLSFRITLESFTMTENMAKEHIHGQMAQSSQGILKAIRKRVLEALHFPVAMNFRYVFATNSCFFAYWYSVLRVV